MGEIGISTLKQSFISSNTNFHVCSANPHTTSQCIIKPLHLTTPTTWTAQPCIQVSDNNFINSNTLV